MKKKLDLNRRFYAMASFEDNSAEITLYGDVVEKQPVNPFTGEILPGDYIIGDEFIADLNEIAASGVNRLTFRINSFGGDASIALLIHNRLRELAAGGKQIVCRVDGVAMSAGSVIMCAADRVIVHPSSLIMIHKCWTLALGGYNADELRSLAKENDAWDKAMISIYSQKSGISETVLSRMMSETTYMTGTEALEKGFADELTEDGGVQIAASANRHALFVSGRRVALPGALCVPDGIPIFEALKNETVTAACADVIDNKSPEETGNRGGSLMANNLTELRAENPELAASIENEVRASVANEHASAVSDACAAERARLSQIDEIAALYDAETVREAKYGESACSAAELAFRAAQKAAKQGGAFMAAVNADHTESGATLVKSVPSPDDTGEGPKDAMAAAKKAVADYVKTKKEAK